MLQDKTHKTSIIISSCIINTVYFALCCMFLFKCLRSLKLHHVIAPCCVFVLLEILIVILEWRLPKLNELKRMIIPQIVLLMETSFITIDMMGYLKLDQLEIFLRLSVILVQYMMLCNILRIVQQGYSSNDNLILQIFAKNSDLVLYESIFIAVWGMTQFILYGQSIYFPYLILCVVFPLIIIVEQFIYGLELYKIVGQNFNDL